MNLTALYQLRLLRIVDYRVNCKLCIIKYAGESYRGLFYDTIPEFSFND
jgi:hypothetical protein